MVRLCHDALVPPGTPSASRGGGHFAILSGVMCVRYQQTTSSCQKSNPTIYKNRISSMLFLQALIVLQESSRHLIPIKERKESKSPLQERFESDLHLISSSMGWYLWFDDLLISSYIFGSLLDRSLDKYLCKLKVQAKMLKIKVKVKLKTMHFKEKYKIKISSVDGIIQRIFQIILSSISFEGRILTLMVKLFFDFRASNVFSQQDLLPRRMMNRVVHPLSVCIKWLDNTFSYYHISCIKRTRCVDLIKLLHFSSLYWNGDLEVITRLRCSIELPSSLHSVLIHFQMIQETSSFEYTLSIVWVSYNASILSSCRKKQSYNWQASFFDNVFKENTYPNYNHDHQTQSSI